LWNCPVATRRRKTCKPFETNIREAIDVYLDAMNIEDEDEEPLPESVGTVRVIVAVDTRVPA